MIKAIEKICKVSNHYTALWIFLYKIECFFCGLLIFPKKFFLSVTGSPAATFLKVLAKAFSPDYSFPRVAYRLP